jgi:hypothetical protein
VSCGRPPFSVTVHSLITLIFEMITTNYLAFRGFAAPGGLCS